MRPTKSLAFLAMLVMLALGVGLVSGCSGSGASGGMGSDNSVADGAAAPAAVPADVPAPAAAVTEAAMASAAGELADLAQSAGGTTAQPWIATGTDTPTPGSNREVITTGSVTLITADVAQAAQNVIALVESAGGWVEQHNESEPTPDRGGQASADLTVRVPAGSMTATVDALKKIGDVRDVSIQAVDVTANARDMDARITALQTSVDRLTTLMSKAGSVEDLLRAEQELTSRQADLDSLRAQRAALSGQVAMSTLSVSIRERAVEVTPTRSGFTGGVQSGWHGLLGFLNALVIVVGVLLPWLIPVALVVAIIWFFARRARRRRAARPASGGRVPDGGAQGDRPRAVPPLGDLLSSGVPAAPAPAGATSAPRTPAPATPGPATVTSAPAAAPAAPGPATADRGPAPTDGPAA